MPEGNSPGFFGVFAMELRQLLKVIFRYRYMIVLMCLSAILTATSLTYVISEKYCASTKILIRPQKAIDMVPKRAETFGFPVGYYTSIGTASKTYTEIIKSRIISERIVQSLGLDLFQKKQGSGLKYVVREFAGRTKELLVKGWTLLKYGRIEKEDAFNSAAEQVQRGLTVTPTKETFLFELKAEAPSPQLASAITNVAGQVLVEYLQELNNLERQKAQQLSENSVEPARQRLEDARKALVEFKEKSGIISLRDETTLQLRSLIDLENNLESVKRETNVILAKRVELARQLQSLGNFSEAAEKVVANPVVQELKLQLVQKEVALEGMRKRYTSEYRDTKALDAEITKIKEKLLNELPTQTSEVTSAVNPLYENILKEQGYLEAELKALDARSADLTRSIEEKKVLIDSLPQKEATLARFELALALEEQKYTVVSKELQELEIAATQEMPNIRMLNRAITPLYPSRPIKIYHTILAALLSLIAGVGIALLKENMNVNVRSIQEAEGLLDLPVLMTVPRLDVGGETPWLLMAQAAKELPEVNRKHERVYVQNSIKIRSAEDMTAKGELVDISMGGACFRVNETYAVSPDDSIEIEVDLRNSSGKKLVLKGIVVRYRKPAEWESHSTIAAKFVDVSQETAEEIRSLHRDRFASSPFLLPPEFEDPIRGLRSDIQFVNEGKMSSFLITSCGIQEGKSTIVANLGLSLVGVNKSTVLIDANLRCPSLHKIFGLPNEAGLSEFLFGRKGLSMSKVSSGLSVVTSGQSVNDPAALLGSETMRRLIRSLSQDFEFVLIDASALLTGSDSELLASAVDAVVLVLDAEKTSIEDSKRAKQILEKTNARILGIVMNNYDNTFESYYSSCGKYARASVQSV
jgi:capsular exopolysaccharide synthesis family protein